MSYLVSIKCGVGNLELSDMPDDNVVQLFKDKKEQGELKRDDIQYFLDELDRSLESFHSLGPMDKFNLYKTLVEFTHTSLGLIKLKGE